MSESGLKVAGRLLFDHLGIVEVNMLGGRIVSQPPVCFAKMLISFDTRLEVASSRRREAHGSQLVCPGIFHSSWYEGEVSDDTLGDGERAGVIAVNNHRDFNRCFAAHGADGNNGGGLVQVSEMSFGAYVLIVILGVFYKNFGAYVLIVILGVFTKTLVLGPPVPPYYGTRARARINPPSPTHRPSGSPKVRERFHTLAIAMRRPFAPHLLPPRDKSAMRAARGRRAQRSQTSRLRPYLSAPHRSTSRPRSWRIVFLRSANIGQV